MLSGIRGCAPQDAIFKRFLVRPVETRARVLSGGALGGVGEAFVRPGGLLYLALLFGAQPLFL